MPRKENTKAKTWERDRRKRMNAYFKTLADLLPPHQEGRKRNKVDILIHASKYIKDLHSRTDELFSTHASEAHKEELARLKKLVIQLTSRTQLLSTLLKEAGISVPAEPALEKISPLKWSNKINVDDVDKYFDKIEEKKTLEKKKKEKSTENKVPSKRKSATSSAPKKLSEEAAVAKKVCNLIENQENRVNCANSKNYNSDSTSSLPETGSKEAERCQNDSANEATADATTTKKKKTEDKKVESQKSLKKKRKRKDEKNSTLPSVANTVTNLTPNALILSGGKLMPLVTPMTSNIIVNTQQASTNPIILGNTQQSQMIVMQPLANRVQNSVVSICNHALINTVQKVTLNTVPNIRANMVVDSHNWASNVKNIINATKIGGHKGILPKGEEITKTTMAYKVPIPAIHKEKMEKPKDSANKKELEVKSKGNKNNSKSHKSVQSTLETPEELNIEKKLPKEPAKTQEDATPRKGTPKRSLSECDSADEPDDKKRKDTNGEAKSAQPVVSKATDFTATCKSIVGLKHVIEKIGEDISEEHTTVGNEKESAAAKSSTVTQVVNENQEETSTTSKLIDIVDTNCFDMNKKTTEDVVAPQTVPSDKFSSESPETDTSDRSSNDFNMRESITEKSGENVDHLNVKSTLTDVEVAEKAVGSDGPKKTCNLGTHFDSLLCVATAKEQQRVNDAMTGAESNKIILNLDTNTTTTMKSDANIVDVTTSVSTSSSSSSVSSPLTANIVNDEAKLIKTSKDEISKSLPYTTDNTFVPISNRTDGLHSDLSNDIFASLHVPSNSHNPESISPTAAFLMAFPLVSSLNGKTEVLEEEMKDDFKYHSQTPPMLLQIGTMEPNSFKIKTSSPSHAIAEKRLKTSCEEKQITSANVNANSDVIVPVECTTTKSLPKVVNEETLREPYKIVQTVLAPSLEKSVMTTNAFPSHTSVNFSTVDSSCIIGNSPSLATNQSRPSQLRTTNNVNVITSQASVNIQASINTPSTNNKSNITDCTSTQVATSRNPDITYSGAQDFLPSYSTIVGNSLGTMQHTSNSSMFKNAIATTQESNPTVGPRVDNNDSQNLLSTRLENTTVTTNSSTAALRSLQTDYSTQTKDKGSQSSSHVIYPSHNKDTLIDSTGIVSDHRVDYSNQMDRSLPVTSQSMQNYSLPTKDSSLPILSSQDMQHMYSQTKDSHVLLDLNGSQQTFNVQKKQEHIIASSHNDYVGNQTKVMQKDSISYTSGDNETTNAPSRNQEYVTKTASQSSSENTFQRNYSKLNKSTDTLNSSNQVNQEAKLNDVLGSKAQEQHNHMRDSVYVPAKKLDVDPFVQSYQYDVKGAMSNPSERTNVLNTNTDGTHNYVSYPSKDDKKTNVAVSTIAMANNNNKTAAVQQGAVARYSQQTSSFITTSNYEQSTMTENHTKSTTTVAHNSSNFSILSWTTFSPVSGGNNNNLVHYDQGQPHSNDNNEAKTICENYSYIPLHKDNSSFSNQVLIGDNYPNSSTMSTGIDKSRQGKIESQKQSFVDPSKTRNDPSKQNRMQNQQNDYKFPDSGKSKNKYNMDSDYMQNEFSSAMEQQQHSQQHGQKNHQNLSSKQEKTMYTYEPQINFDLAESNVQMKYPIEAYTGVNFKYAEKTTQQPSQHKYQVLTQGQISLHDNGSYSSDVKHSQQQQQSQQSHSSNNNGNNNKSKSNQHQQHAIKAPVNWMMTPEVKHNANITDIILPPIGKELEFCPNNLFTQTPAYNQGTSNQFYNNYDVSAAHSFPNLPVLQSDPKRPVETFYSEEQPFPWSPTKNSVHNSVEHAIGQSSVKCIDQHIVPSNLQSLVGDLDLSTNLEKQNFLFGAATSSSRISAEQSKDASIKEKEANNVSGRDLHAILNTQNAQHPASTFLSVSQLVEHEKAEKSHQQQNHQQHQHHQHHHPHQHQHSQHQQQQQQQARKHQRKSNASPRTTSKRQMDIRKSTTTNDNNNLHQRHEEQKSSGHVFTEQGYQQSQQQQQPQQKYQQNNVHWRSRNCKSNYTAEALIGTSIHDTSGHQDKHASIKFTTNYPQNKFQSGLSADATVMPINYFSSAPPPDDGTAAGYGQSVVNQNFNTYTYSSNSANSIYPTSNFITSISNTPNSYMTMPLHENATDYVQEANNFLLPNVAGTSSSSSASTANTSSVNTTSTTTGNVNGNGKNHQHYGKHPNCDKRSYSTAAKKGKRKALESGPMQNLEFPLSGINSPLEDYHHSTTFLAPPPPPPPPPHTNPLYQNHPQTNVYAKTVNGLPPPPSSAMASAQGVATVGATSFSMNSNMVRGGIVSSNPMAMPHHPSGTSLTNFNLSTIFPEMNDKVTGYKSSNGIQPGLSQTSNQSATYAQRSNYPSNSLCHLPQVCL